MQDGATLRQHYESLMEQTGIEHEMLKVERPHEVGYLLDYFASMGARRAVSGGEPQPLSSFEVQGWAALRGIRLSVLEVEVLGELERIHLLGWARGKGK